MFPNFFSVYKRHVDISEVILNNSGSKQYKMHLSVTIQANGWSNGKLVIFFFFNWDSLHARLNSHYEASSYKKKAQKRLQNKENLFGKNLQLKDVC